MAQDRTAGFDMLVQLRESELNTQLASAFLGGLLFPPSMSVPLTIPGVTGTADLNFLTPTLDVDRPRPQMGLTVPFANSQLTITAPLASTIAPLSGTITIVDSVEILTEGGAQAAALDFTAAAPNVTVDFDPASEALLAPLLALAGMTIAQAETAAAADVISILQTSVRRLLLTPFIPVTDDTDPVTIFDLDVTTVNDTSAADNDCLTFGVRMDSATGGNINLITSTMIPAGSPSMVMMSNLWLLGKVMRPRLAASLGLMTSDFDLPLHLNHSVPAPGGTGTLTNLDAFIEGSRIRIDGRARTSGTGWSATADFTLFVSLSIDATGSIAISTTTPVVNTDIDLEWWVWIASAVVGGIIGGVIGAIVAVIVVAVAEAVVEGVANGLVSSSISGSLGSFSSIPLGPIGSTLSMSSLVLDDLELRGSIVRAATVPERNGGSLTTAAHRTFDFDAGTSSSVTVAGTDLIWDPVTGFVTSGGTRLSISGRTFGNLDPLAISQLALTSTTIPRSMVPLRFDLGPFTIGDRVVFGLRTGDGRLAKARASVDQGGQMTIEWVTYDNPIPSLSLTQRWCVHERGPVEEYISDDCSRCTTSEIAWCGTIEAITAMVPFPIDYQWCLCGHVLDKGKGEIETDDGRLTYTLEDRKLCVQGELGQDINCEVCVSAIDARGHELYTCARLVQLGRQTVCRPCVPKTAVPINYAALDVSLAGYRPMFAFAGAAKSADPSV